jgi:predicted dehydrogenase
VSARAIAYDVVGCGAVTLEYHAPILAKLRRRGLVRVVRCVDLDEGAAQEVARRVGAESYGPPDGDAVSDGADAALIATPPASHLELASRYLEAGKHVFVEKPFVTSGDDARSLAAAAAARDLCVHVNHFWRLYPSAETARSVVADGYLGRIELVEGSEGLRWEWPARSDYMVSNRFGGVLFDIGAHLIDLVSYVLSADRSPAPGFRIVSVEKSPRTEPSHDCRFSAELDTGAGEATTVDLHVSRVEPLLRGVKLVGERGTLFVPTTFGLAPTLLRKGREPLTLAREHARPASARECFVEAHERFLACCGGRPGPAVLAAERFLLTSDLLEAVWGSS